VKKEEKPEKRSETKKRKQQLTSVAPIPPTTDAALVSLLVSWCATFYHGVLMLPLPVQRRRKNIASEIKK